MGRRKIEIEPLEDDRNRSVTFAKRKAGLFKKAYELSVLCEVDLAVIIVGSNNKVYEFSSVDTHELLNSYRTANLQESKLLENYGNYKKRTQLKMLSYPDKNEENSHECGDDAAADSVDESDESPKKRQKKDSSDVAIYSQQSDISSRFAQLANLKHINKPDQELPLHRPVLRVQIPTDNSKSSEKLATNVTDLDGPDDIKISAQSVQQSSIAYSLSRFKSPDVKKPPLPRPSTHKLQTLSPLSATHPLPVCPNGQYYSLPPPSPCGNFPQSILHTPIFNQSFNAQLMNPIGGINSTPIPLTAGSMSGQSMGNLTIGTTTGNAASSVPTPLTLMPQRALSSDATLSSACDNSSSVDIEAPKSKPTLHQQTANGEQTPMSGLPLRYMNENFLSPSNFYALQEWPAGLTPYSSSMSQYFLSKGPSASGAAPLYAYANTARNSILGTVRPGPTPVQPLTTPPMNKEGEKPSQNLANDNQILERED